MDTKKNAVVHVTVLIIISLIVIALVLANSNFSFADFLLKLHGG